MAPYEALYGRRCRSPVGWSEPGEARLLGTDLVCDALEKMNVIQERFCTTQSRQKSYANMKARDVVYMVGEEVLLKVPPMKGVMRLGKKGKLSPRYISPFEVLERVGELDGDLTYDVEPVTILDRQVRKLRLKNIASMKVHWRGQPIEKATWESEQEIDDNYL
ncbi:uncharacterized protein [Nicotiana tomentosiformis]|uniref:uncharacterized protein n=1 Tax=Nicotiana tomentosiformis TaxID=4098 RepID=UPI00388C5F2E